MSKPIYRVRSSDIEICRQLAEHGAIKIITDKTGAAKYVGVRLRSILSRHGMKDEVVVAIRDNITYIWMVAYYPYINLAQSIQDSAVLVHVDYERRYERNKDVDVGKLKELIQEKFIPAEKEPLSAPPSPHINLYTKQDIIVANIKQQYDNKEISRAEFQRLIHALTGDVVNDV